MNKLQVCLAAMLISGAAALAVDYPEFTQWMKYHDQAASALRKMEQKTGPQAVRAAEYMATVNELMIGFFRQHGDRKTVKLAEDGKAAATALMNAASAKDAAGADAAFKTLSGTCQPCHEQYRERDADGKYHFKFQAERRPQPAAPKPAPAK
jgi:cytochrome c556